MPVTVITTTGQALDLIDRLGTTVAAMDTETVYDGERADPMTARLRVISIATEAPGGDDAAYVLDVRDMDTRALGQAFRRRAADLGRRKLRFLGFNADFDDLVTTLNLTPWDVASGQAFPSLFHWMDLSLALAVQGLGAAGHRRYVSLATAVRRKLGIDIEGKGTVQLSYDAETDLTDEQIAYAAADAVATLWLGDALAGELDRQGLAGVASLESQARPFLQSMRVHGIAFSERTWRKELAGYRRRAEELRHQMAALTGGGQMSLFSDHTALSWKPESPNDVRKVLNTRCAKLVKAYLAQRHPSSGGRGRLLTDSDSLTKEELELMARLGEELGLDVRLPRALIEYGKVAKLLSTYGDKMMAELGEDGRFHSRYTQCLADTGRTSSRGPNAQNFAPAMKRHFRPRPRSGPDGAPVERVLLYGDYSQAELRVSAQLTGERVRRQAFEDGVDQHAAIAAEMFHVDMDALKNGDEEARAAYSSFRGRAKPLNFGLGYGMKAQLMADNLTLGGTPTTKEEAQELIDKFFAAVPQEAAWLRGRDGYVQGLAAAIRAGREERPLDLRASWRLHHLWQSIGEARKALKNAGRKPSDEAVIAHLTGELGAAVGLAGTPATEADRAGAGERQRALAADLRRALRLDAPVLLCADGEPWEFESRTIAGRRRLFQVPTGSWLTALALELASPTRPRGQELVDDWAAANGVELSRREPNGRRRNLRRAELEKRFEKPERRDAFVRWMLNALREQPRPGRMSVPERLMRAAAASCVDRMANAYRNAPIQGSVADGVLLAFAKLTELLEEYPTAFPVISIHDSIALECDAADAAELLPRMRQVMEACLRHYCPDVPIVADVAILTSLDDKHDDVTGRYRPALAA
ncbi:DNA polymerase [Bailinhaonella thermotolerans]|uniref:DNA polymerase n=1 Tax=Bailinhaonella thermotolerans TaxID=1070861 RepID=UPI00192A4454|nr:DNA polymerase [Bailinhaonella thermotolerans]